MKQELWKDFFSTDYIGFSEVILNKERTNFEVKQLKRLIPNKNVKILDLGCGQGRITIPLAKEGYNIIGLDASADLLNEAMYRAEKEKVNVNFLHEDMRQISYYNEFDIILNMGTAFGYIENSNEDEEVLAKIYKALKPDGIFIQETENREMKLKNLMGKLWHEMNGQPVFSDRKFDITTGRWEEIISWYINGSKQQKTLNLRLYSATELIKMHKEVGFKNIDLYGGFDYSPLSMESERLLVLSKKVRVAP
ncbi:class I SAM-dependent methyltransferase [Bacillus sp. 166amftsu]|uniref:class I SAM-dependent methyltransferase n=1 Tax=Bacillus sp. 166amftsu TaxID=1761753 RepID=UPI000895D9B2|nr:class I SAM-dependent methyltransferase [Bacillus sp. 166amftsu]SDZ37811.1 2-polyprenyl-3-methyl-5-hydroxy-6-metoxy-1,4-benzoquinol methylase [Bacillus sp. 166amftsu]